MISIQKSRAPVNTCHSLFNFIKLTILGVIAPPQKPESIMTWTLILVLSMEVTCNPRVVPSMRQKRGTWSADMDVSASGQNPLSKDLTAGHPRDEGCHGRPRLPSPICPGRRSHRPVNYPYSQAGLCGRHPGGEGPQARVALIHAGQWIIQLHFTGRGAWGGQPIPPTQTS